RAGDVADLAARAVVMLTDRAAWPRYRAAGRRFVEEERGWARAVARYRDVYGHALGRVG
ncbi:MAG: glycosyltransferase WbuB, partial [Nitrospirae bacterium CG_4_8_14_3_um_filter_70_85]